MSEDRAEHYRKVMEQKKSIDDPLVMVRVTDLRALLDVYEWYTAGERPRVRVKARKETA